MSTSTNRISTTSTSVGLNEELALEVSQSSIDVVDNDLSLEVHKKEYSIVGDGLYAQVNTEEAPQWLTSIIDSVIEKQLNRGLAELATSRAAILAAIDEIEIAKNTYSELINIEATIEGIIASRVAALNASLGQNRADIVELDATKVSEDQAAAIAIERIAADVAGGNIRSEIDAINTAVSTLDASTATSVDILTSTLADQNTGIEANAAATSVLSTYVGLDEADANYSTSLSAYLKDSNGVLGGADSSLATDIKIESNNSIITAFDYDSSISYNGVTYPSGFGMKGWIDGGSPSATPGSEFWIKADTFRFSDANGASLPVFTIDSVSRQAVFDGKVIFGNSQTGTIDEAIAASIPTHTSGGGNPVHTTEPINSTYLNIDDDSLWTYTTNGWKPGGDPNALTAEDLGPTGTTVIDGGRITTGVLDADRIDTDSLFAQNIAFTGRIVGGSGGLGGLIESENYINGVSGMQIDLITGSIYIA